MFTAKFKKSKLFRILSAAMIFSFSLTLIPGQAVFGQTLIFPPPGVMVNPTPGYIPTLIRGLVIHPENPLKIDFIVDTGHDKIKGEALKQESLKLIKYFLASLTVPEKDMWVNLSPYEKNRIIPDLFGKTGMGRDLLIQDYILKQLTASLMYPERELGRNFWNKVYAQVKAKYGTEDIPVDTFNKVWIVPEQPVVYQDGAKVFVLKNKLKVMMEQDYLAMTKNNRDPENVGAPPATAGRLVGARPQAKATQALASQITKEIIIPAIEKEVNEGKNFANLRQIYNSMILAAWYKVNLKESFLGKIYVDKNKTKGVDHNDPGAKEQIYRQYLEAFKKGAFDYVKEETNPVTEETTSRKYFSGGIELAQAASPATLTKQDGVFSPTENGTVFAATVDLRSSNPSTKTTAASPLTIRETQRTDNRVSFELQDGTGRLGTLEAEYPDHNARQSSTLNRGSAIRARLTLTIFRGIGAGTYRVPRYVQSTYQDGQSFLTFILLLGEQNPPVEKTSPLNPTQAQERWEATAYFKFGSNLFGKSTSYHVKYGNDRVGTMRVDLDSTGTTIDLSVDQGSEAGRHTFQHVGDFTNLPLLAVGLFGNGQYLEQAPESSARPNSSGESVDDSGDSSSTPTGGIDLEKTFGGLKIKRDARGVPLPLLQQPVEIFNHVDGLYPEMEKMLLIPSLPAYLGFAKPQRPKGKTVSSFPGKPALSPGKEPEASDLSA
ncbi:MAG: hypothetical protein HQL23_09240 [Candidatus Omnitrophica bacterium]|nr:hypothetical protein [Candidatus Omnitrophota bacterium]